MSFCPLSWWMLSFKLACGCTLFLSCFYCTFAESTSSDFYICSFFQEENINLKVEGCSLKVVSLLALLSFLIIYLSFVSGSNYEVKQGRTFYQICPLEPRDVTWFFFMWGTKTGLLRFYQTAELIVTKVLPFGYCNFASKVCHSLAPYENKASSGYDSSYNLQQ